MVVSPGRSIPSFGTKMCRPAGLEYKIMGTASKSFASEWLEVIVSNATHNCESELSETRRHVRNWFRACAVPWGILFQLLKVLLPALWLSLQKVHSVFPLNQLFRGDGEHGKSSEFHEPGPIVVLHLPWSTSGTKSLLVRVFQGNTSDKFVYTHREHKIY